MTIASLVFLFIECHRYTTRSTFLVLGTLFALPMFWTEPVLILAHDDDGVNSPGWRRWAINSATAVLVGTGSVLVVAIIAFVGRQVSIRTVFLLLQSRRFVSVCRPVLSASRIWWPSSQIVCSANRTWNEGIRLNPDPLSPDSDHRFRMVMSVVGGATSVLNPVLYWIITPSSSQKYYYVSLFALPVIWAVATVWLIKTDRRLGRVAMAAMTVAPMVVAVSVFALLGMGFDLKLQLEGIDAHRGAPVLHLLIPVGSFACCGWPAGLVCGIYVLTTCIDRLWRTTKGDIMESDEDISTKGRP